MPKREYIITVVNEWIAKAENDIKSAQHLLTTEDECLVDTVCFHAQQCVEKYLKALLVLKVIPFPKTHNIPALMTILPAKLQKIMTVDEQNLLTEYATVTRYPGYYEDISFAEARDSIRIARRVRKIIRGLLPKEAKIAKRKKMLLRKTQIQR